MSVVSIAQDPDVAAAVRDALELLDGLRELVRGRVVAVKPNETWASADDTTAVTQPETLRAVLRYLGALEPREIVCSGGAGAAETDDVMRVSGMMRVLEEEDVAFFDHNRAPFVEVPLDYGDDAEVRGPQRSVMVNPRVLEYDVLVSLAQLKVHEVATVTLSLKNIAMSYPAADYYGHPRSEKRHENSFFDDMHSFIAAMAKRFPIALAIVVGQPAMVGIGPIGGHAVDTGIVVASTDALAADVVGARLLGVGVQGARHLWEAARLGVGESKLDEIEIRGMPLPDAVASFAEQVYGKRIEMDHP